jgi:hypothetical protein
MLTTLTSPASPNNRTAVRQLYIASDVMFFKVTPLDRERISLLVYHEGKEEKGNGNGISS